jgi:hypothetical protein
MESDSLNANNSLSKSSICFFGEVFIVVKARREKKNSRTEEKGKETIILSGKK